MRPIAHCRGACYSCRVPEASEQDKRRIAAESMLDLRTVRRAYAGGVMTLATRAAIQRAAEVLGLPLPPDGLTAEPRGKAS